MATERTTEMMVRVELFGQLAEAAKARAVEVTVPQGATSKTVREQLASSVPALASYLHLCVLAVNHEYATEEQPIHTADEVALIGLVSGG